MKQSGICPKCGGREILIIPGESGPYGSGNNIPVGWSIFSAVKVNRYLCCSCGYSEEWIDKEDIPTLVAKYKKEGQNAPVQRRTKHE